MAIAIGYGITFEWDIKIKKAGYYAYEVAKD